MVAFDKKTIASLTQLSKIKCTEEELEVLLKNLQKILAYFDQLNEIDVSNVAPCNQVIPNMSNVVREDVVGKTMPREVFLENAPAQIGGLIRVPPVIKT